MIFNYFKIAFRSLRKHRTASFAKIFGLTLGITCCIMVFALIHYETSFDAYHTQAPRIYRVNLVQEKSADRVFNGNNFYPLGKAVRQEISGVKTATSVHGERNYTVTINKNTFQGKFAFFVDPHYAELFDVQWLKGDAKTSLVRPDGLVVTTAFADNFLGGAEKSLGAIVLFNNTLQLTVTGVVSSPPSNTDHPYSVLISYAALKNYLLKDVEAWNWVDKGATYVLVPEARDLKSVGDQLNQLIPKYLGEESAKSTHFSLMALSNIHDRNGNFNNFNYEFPLPVLIMLSILAVLVLITSCINYINLATAEGVARAGEIGIRKTFGALRSQLAFQFLSETFVVTGIALLFSLILSRIGIAKLQPILRSDGFGAGLFTSFHFIAACLVLLVCVPVLAGFYPSLILSKMPPVTVLRGDIHKGKSRGRLRKVLILVQFTVAQILLLITFIQLNQVELLKSKPLGYNNELVVSIVPPKGANKTDVFMNDLSSVKGIINVSYKSFDAPVTFGSQEDLSIKAGATSYYVDENYLNTLEFSLLAGKGFTSQSNGSEIIVNEVLLKHLNIKQPEFVINKLIPVDGRNMLIVGVVKDFYPKGGLSVAQPYIFKFTKEPEYFNLVFAKIANRNIPATLADIEKSWTKTFPDQLYNYLFLDDWLNSQFDRFNSFLKLLYLFCGLTIVIGGLGLYSFVAFITNQRSKEVAIRKVMGAPLGKIIWLLNKEIAVLISVSFLISVVVAYFIGGLMLHEFAEQYSIGLGVFVLELTLIFVLVAVITGYKSLTTARANPIHSLRLN